jgi:ribonuclease J
MSSLQWHILGGNNKASIGANSGLCTYDYEDENGKVSRKSLLFDAGLLIHQYKAEDPALADSDLVMPDFEKYLYKVNDPGHVPETPIDAIFLTHNHVDHTGALPLLILQGYKLPKIYATPYTARRLEQELSNAGLDPAEWPEIYRIAPGSPVQEGPVSVSAFWVSHSTPQSVGFYIDTPKGTILHTGDFKMDDSVVWGPAFSKEQFKRIVTKPVDLMLMDSTGANKDEEVVSEQDVRDSLHEIIAQHPGKRVIVAVMSGYEENLASVAKVATEEKRTMWVSGAAHEQTLAALRDTGLSLSDYVGEDLNLRILDKNSRDDLAAASPEQSIVVVTGSQGHANSSLAMAAEGRSNFLKLDKDNDVIVFCAPSMPGNVGLRESFLSNLREKGFTVLTKNEMPLYSPAHARLPELIEMIKLADPKHVLPIHGSAELREAAASAVDKMGRKAVRADNGDVLAVSHRSVKSTTPVTQNAPPLIGLKTLQGMGKDGWKDRYYLQVNAPQKAAPPEISANGNKKHRPKIFNINP